MTPKTFFAVFLSFISALQAGDTIRPNIVFFLVDDLGYADCGFNGGKEIKTPNIDRLAASGAVIENHYVQPVCSPTRAALLTGRYPTHTGVYSIIPPGAQWGLALEERTLADALRAAGYHTALTGKWHLGEFEKAYQPNARGFDHQYGHFFGMIDYFTHERTGKLDWYRNGELLREEGYTTRLIAREACRLIEAGDGTHPLFIYVPFNGVHSPFQVPDEYLLPYAHLSGARRKLAGMLAAVDEAIGQIEASLKRAGLLENTLIVFSSDNGGPHPGDNTPLRDFKGTIYEGGTRAAAFATWPGRIPAGQRVAQPMHVVDWYPTLVKLAGGSLEQNLTVDGLDVWPMLTLKKPSPHDAILSVSTRGPSHAALRMGDWKLLLAETPPPARTEKFAGSRERKNESRKASLHEDLALYNLTEDPSEAKNLAAVHPERVASMRTRLEELLKDAVKPGSQKSP